MIKIGKEYKYLSIYHFNLSIKVFTLIFILKHFLVNMTILYFFLICEKYTQLNQIFVSSSYETCITLL